MLVKFVLRTPGNHHEIGKGNMPSVPRKGDLVTINDAAHLVHEVNWNVTEMSVTVLLNE